MQNSKVLPVVGLVLLAVALIANHAFGRLEVAQPHLLPIETFPRTVGEWSANQDIPIDPAVYASLTTAHVVDRVYTNPAGRTADLTLVTATNYLDFHDPQACFPGQGWNLSNFRTVSINGVNIKAMSAQRGDSKMLVFYWLTGSFIAADGSFGKADEKLYALRQLFVKDKGDSLFVRLTTSDDDAGLETLRQFVLAIQPALKQITDTKMHSSPPGSQ